MPELVFTGPSGRLEGRYQAPTVKGAPIAIILHGHPNFGGNMNHPIVYNLYYAFSKKGFATLRFNFRGIGRSQGVFDQGLGELADTAAALDWMQSVNPEAKVCWIAGASFGSWVGMQLLMRRPEIEGFISVSAIANYYDMTFLAPCPSSGLFIHGAEDKVAPIVKVAPIIQKIKTQKGVSIDFKIVEGANHFFSGKIPELKAIVDQYLTDHVPNFA